MAGFQNNPLTKFPLAIHPPGSSSRAAPGSAAHGMINTPIGPLNRTSHDQLTPLGARVKMFSGLRLPFNK